jgi:hypothetical protein
MAILTTSASRPELNVTAASSATSTAPLEIGVRFALDAGVAIAAVNPVPVITSTAVVRRSLVCM